MATDNEVQEAKNDAMLALLKNVEKLALLPQKSNQAYDSMMNAALAYRYVAGGSQPS